MNTGTISETRGALLRVVVLGCVVVLAVACGAPSDNGEVTHYEPTWNSLRGYKEVPDWLRDGKFGIYTHWGPYAVHAHGANTTWYSFALYNGPDSGARTHFEETFGKLTPEFGYKDLIPKFTAENFDADEWAELFAKAGAKFAGPVAEHHDGFAMWDTKYSDWNAAKMGPKRDVVGELERAIKARDMKFVTAFHHAANWFFFPVWDERYDTGNLAYSDLYGQPHMDGAMRNQAFIDEWQGKIYEVIDTYSPDYIWFDFGLDFLPEGYVKDFLAYYYNHAEANGKEVVVTYKTHDLVPGSALLDHELGQERQLTYHEWITDSTVDDRGAWGWADDLEFKTPNRVIDNLVDRVSKNGYLLLNVGPKPDGTIPEGARDLLLGIGAWLDVNGEAIYGTTPWLIAEEGPTNLGKLRAQGGFNESDVVYTGEDIRFTTKGDTLYATMLAWPGNQAVIRSIRAESMMQSDEDPEAAVAASPPLAGKTFTLGGSTWTFGENGKVLISDGKEGGSTSGRYEQDGTKVYVKIAFITFNASYDGENFTISQEEERVAYYPGFYREEIKRISLLGHDEDLDWKFTRSGLVVDLPDEPPTEHAHVLKIERHHHPPIE